MRNRVSRAAAVFCLVIFPGVRLGAQTPADPGSLLRVKFQEQVESVVAKADAVVGVAIRDLGGDQVFLYNADEVFPLASSIKIAILAEVLRQAAAGELSLDQRVLLASEDKVGGSGILQHLTDPALALSVRDLCVLMIVLSDNTATNVLIDQVGMDRVNASLSAWGLGKTRLQRRMMDYEAARRGEENIGTPAEMTDLLVRLRRGELLPEGETATLRQILGIYKSGPLRQGIPSEVVVENKAGSVEGVRCDVGIVEIPGRPYVISVMTKYLPEGAAESRSSGERIISSISRLAYDYAGRLAHSNQYGRRFPQP